MGDARLNRFVKNAPAGECPCGHPTANVFGPEAQTFGIKCRISFHFRMDNHEFEYTRSVVGMRLYIGSTVTVSIL